MNTGHVREMVRHLLSRLKKMRLETWFILIFLIFGIIFTIIIPPGWNTDETNHVFRIYQLSVGDLRSEKVIDPQTGLKAYGGLVPTNLLRLFNRTGASLPGTVGDPNRKIDKELYNNHPSVLSLKDDGRRTSINFSGAALYSPVTYAIYLPIFWLGKLISLPFFWIIMLSRLVGLLLTGLAFFFVIKYIPIGKWIFFVVGLIPTVVVQATTVGADAQQLAVSVLFVAYITWLLFVRKKPRLLDYGILTILGASLVLIKLAYAPILLLLLALPFINKEYRSRKNIAFVTLVLVIAIVPGLIWTRLVSYIDINSNPQANFTAQRMFIASQPFTYVKTLYYTFFTNTQMTLSNIFGSFIWDSVALPAIYAYIVSAAVFSSLFVKSRREVNIMNLSKRSLQIWRSLLIVSSFVTIVLIATALYIYSTTLHQSSIVGIQSRYFIPLLPIILLVFYGNTVKNQHTIKIGIIVLSCITLVGAVLAIYFRLYQAPALILS